MQKLGGTLDIDGCRLIVDAKLAFEVRGALGALDRLISCTVSTIRADEAPARRDSSRRGTGARPSPGSRKSLRTGVQRDVRVRPPCLRVSSKPRRPLRAQYRIRPSGPLGPSRSRPAPLIAHR